MNFLFGTTAFSDLMREHPGLDAHLATISPTDDRVVICSISLSPFLSFHNGQESRLPAEVRLLNVGGRCA
jgi:hypothetical protein